MPAQQPDVLQPAIGNVLIKLLAFTLIISSMSATMFNIVLPEIRTDFNLSVAQVSWVSTSYLLIYAVGSVIYGKLLDRYQAKNLITFGLLVFASGSLLGLLAGSFPFVLMARILQAVGASVIPALAMLIPVRYFPPERRGHALGISATGLALGNAIGPIISSLLVSFVHWRWLFAIPLLILITMPFYRKHLSSDIREGGHIDWLGGGLLIGTVALLLLAITQGNLWLGAGSALMVIGFLWRIRTAADPFISRTLLRDRIYLTGLMIAAVVMSISYALPFLTPQLLSDINQLAPGVIGFVMVPGACLSAYLGRKVGKLADSKGNSFVYHTASLLLFSCFLLLSIFVGSPAALIGLIFTLGNAGQMFMQIVLSNTISRSIPKDQIGVGMGMLTLCNFLSGAIATGIYGKVMDHGASSSWIPWHTNEASFVFSNLYLVLALIHIGLLIVYRSVYVNRRKTTTAGQMLSN
ncbi:DHA2 family metal-tetracycline-proton antiporter-like MFS transporter [Paenibacillus cellulosilyticus]|uniref:DHA2 family metal-tetracycline-proton antiporter-like MFS transporter n=1 Tax=Paenibacillus cellulosilyticus TaxID=375489 RepID=A0A2V2YTN4_9BACL|nr:MFS transporter [Paenibacillus cellulosilyticus]PWW02775.1 DHA2 family metal-tetracycline-proton antiporter-like MFS transporter [Paenibacillus cellulosilyticus]QKS45698.1 MFS transporter [Paenibacillus cellulosilyticus]